MYDDMQMRIRRKTGKEEMEEEEEPEENPKPKEKSKPKEKGQPQEKSKALQDPGAYLSIESSFITHIYM